MPRLGAKPGFIDIRNRVPLLLKYFESKGDILAAYLYGSYGTGEQTPLSDVDIAILLKRGVKDSFDEQLEISSKVAEIANNDDVNVLVLNTAPVLLQFRVIKSGRLLFARDQDELADFQELVCKVYADFMPDYQAFARDYDQALKEAYLNGGQG
ncbi:MAG: type VII toxin-antitoxin system MntA family adenylyltransferase antitoxin [Eubacteriales bacterium]